MQQLRNTFAVLSVITLSLFVVLCHADLVHARTERAYFIQVEVEDWDYGATGLDLTTGRLLTYEQPESFQNGNIGMEMMMQPWAYFKRTELKNSTLQQQFIDALPDLNLNGGMGPMPHNMAIHPRVGGVYKKLVMHEYTDKYFTTRKDRSDEELHLGVLGPTIRAEVGDIIKVTFRNGITANQMTTIQGIAGLELSLHPHGVFYTGEMEGAPYVDNQTVSNPGSGRTRRGLSAMQADMIAKRMANLHHKENSRKRAGLHLNTSTPQDSVPAGQQVEYFWEVPARAGPGPADGSSVCWFYHSHVDEPGDTNGGMIGAMIITRKGHAKPDATPIDVDREIINVFTVFDENSSPLIIANTWPLFQNLPNMHKMHGYHMLSMNMMWMESNRMYTINGHAFANVPGIYMKKSERVRWYVGSLGNERDVHGAHWHGNTLVHSGNRVDSIPLIPAVFTTVDMTPDNVGQWLYHCHTNHHIHGGMVGLYEVQECAPNCRPEEPEVTTVASPPQAAPVAKSSNSSASLTSASVLLFALSSLLALFA